MSRSKLSNIIEEFLQDMMSETHDGMIEIQRNVLAEHFDCSPSQINYVLSTRFTPYKGYYIESRRGGGGYIRIIKVTVDEQEEDYRKILMDAVGNSITKDKGRHIVEGLVEEDIISTREARLIMSAIGDRSLSQVGEIDKNTIRASILQNILLIVLEQEG
ncbi:MAG: CtsR family transcriptional regulator [Tissierellia bacterium]|nr:CtsR family transcriptional regulator [Tissierellia bacterium]